MATPRYSYKWKPIEDLNDSDRVANDELAKLSNVWEEQKQRLRHRDGAIKEFNDRLIRSWSIETGVIERVYSLDRGITQVLIERGLDSMWITHDSTNLDPKLVGAILRDHQESIEGLFEFVKGSRVLSTSYIKDLHAQLTLHQDVCEAVDQFGNRGHVQLLRGAYKKLPNNPSRADGSIHQYCPPEHVDSEMERLIDLHRRHASVAVSSEVEAAWLHHRFTQIHPFQDGNGRVARCLATLVMLKAGWFPPVVTRDDNEKYIDALEKADSGDLSPLVSLFSSLERTAFVQALAIVPEAIKSTSLKAEIEAIGRELRRRQQQTFQDWEKAKDIAEDLLREAVKRFESVKDDLDKTITAVDPQCSFSVDSDYDGGNRRFWHQQTIFEAAHSLAYFVNTSTYHAWVRLALKGTPETSILVSIHGIGREFKGVLAVSGLLYSRAEGEDGRKEVSGIVPLSDAIFQVNYLDDPEKARSRFSDWMEEVLRKGVAKWRESL